MPATEKKLRDLTEALILQESTITLATAINSTPWSAPVYYVYVTPKFYFFSNPSARHIQYGNIVTAAASIFSQNLTTWKDIRGIQMSGVIEKNQKVASSFQVINQYLKKFPFTKSFFSSEKLIDLALFKSRFKAELYCFNPREIYYLDNTIRFGFKELVQL